MPDAVYDVKTLSPFSPPSAATAVLILEDGSIFYGSGFGAEATNVDNATTAVNSTFFIFLFF